MAVVGESCLVPECLAASLSVLAETSAQRGGGGTGQEGLSSLFSPSRGRPLPAGGSL